MQSEQGERLRQFRKTYGLTQGQMALLEGVTRKTSASWENGKLPRSAKARKRIAEILELDEDGLRQELKLRYRQSAMSGAVAGVGVGAAASAFGGAALGIPAGLFVARQSAKLLGEALEDASVSIAEASVAEGIREEYDERSQGLGVLATFLIRARLDELGIAHSVIVKPEEEVGLTPDQVVLMPGNRIESWWLCFWPEQRQVDEMIGLTKEARAHLMFARFLECIPDESRKMSMVIDDVELFDEFVKLSGRNSYRGNLSVVLVDPVERKLVSEVYLATYKDPNATVTPFRVVGR